MADLPEPADPVAAVTHPDPYAYYARLAARGLHRDPRLGLWVAAGAAVAAVLESPRCRVRPPAEPVPPTVAGTAVGGVFGRLVRMTDGPDRAPVRAAVERALAAADLGRAREVAASWTAARFDALPLRAQPRRVMTLAFEAPPRVMAALLGLEGEALASATETTGAYVRALAPHAGRDDVERASQAVEQTVAALPSARGLMRTLADAAVEVDEAVVVANAFGFLSQSYEATAGLIGNALVALAAAPARAADVDGLVAAVLRDDPPVHNTRRFVADPGLVAGVPLDAGDAILVVLAASDTRPPLTFGHGGHACPGDALARTIAGGCLEALRARGFDWRALAGHGYRPLPNVRIPVFEGATVSP